jgi:molecular chaperone DnaK
MIEKCSGKVAIYDLGGGTFDVSILELQDGIYQVLAAAGDTYLGGEDFDDLIMQWLVDEFRNEHGIDVREDMMALQRLKEAAEKAKCELSTQPQAEIVLPFFSATRAGPLHLNTVLPRARFEQMIQPMLEHTAELCRDALRDGGLKTEDIDIVVPVGGQTRTPAVLEAIQKIFEREPLRSVNPDEVVGIGAAIQTGILQGVVTDLVLLDVTPHTLGLQTRDGRSTPVIERNTNIPTRISRTFTTVADHQTDVEVHVLQGESSWARENTSLGRFMLTGLAPRPSAEPKIEVTFEIDLNGIVQVTALDADTGRQQNIVVRPSGGLTQAEVDRARIDTERRIITTPARLTGRLLGLLWSARKSYLLVVTTLTDAERDSARQAFARAEEARDGSLEEMQAALDALEMVAEMLGRAML